MSAIRSYNKTILIGNLTRDPELKDLESGSKLCTFAIATNYSWKTKEGERKFNVEFHTIVTWNRLAEICAQILRKGMLVFIEGEIRTRVWRAEDGTEHEKKEIRAEEVKLMDDKGKMLRKEDGKEDKKEDAPKKATKKEKEDSKKDKEKREKKDSK